MRILVDADACPKPIKDILYRVANRLQIELTLFANKPMYSPPSKFIKSIVVPSGFDEADDRIAERVSPGDLVVTADIPLAARVISLGGQALNPRGELYTLETIEERMKMRDFMEILRGSGVVTGGPSSFSQGDRRAFASQLDKLLAKQVHPVSNKT